MSNEFAAHAAAMPALAEKQHDRDFIAGKSLVNELEVLEYRALLNILALGNRQINAGETLPLAGATARIKAKRAAQ